MEKIRFDASKMALVLEGGAMRGVFTAGVLDSLMDRHIEFPYVVGVSGGASNAVSYKSHQRGRAHHSYTTQLEAYGYVGWRQLLRKGRMIDMDYLFEEYVYRDYPFDFDAYFANPMRLEMVATDCLTGEAHYLSEERDAQRAMTALRSSCNLPIINAPVMMDGTPMADGGLVDSIPLRHALEQGYERALVVLTHNVGFRRKEHLISVPDVFSGGYPMITRLMRERAAAYNAQMEYVERLEAEGRIIVARPCRPLQVSRFTSHVPTLQSLYEEGYSISQHLQLR